MKCFITLYRPSSVQGLAPTPDGWVVIYRLGDLRAKVFGIRVPVLWALDQVLTS